MNVLKLLFNPIFLLAAGLHAGLLLIPVAGGSSDTVVPAPDPEGESITVTRIPPKASQTAKPAGPPGASTTATRPAASVVPAPRPAAGAQGTPSSQPAQARPQSNQASSASTSTTASQSSSNQPEPSSSVENSGSGLPELPPIGSSTESAGDDTASSSSGVTSAPQAPPTLLSLKEKAERREVPQLLETFLARLQHSVLRTTDPETAEAQQTWLASLSENLQLNISTATGLENSLEISYPYTADDGRRFLSCLTPEPEKGLVGVVVDADGAIATAPTLLRSSGYEFLNEIALDQISAYTDFPEADIQKAYTVDVDVDYDQDACVSLAELQAD